MRADASGLLMAHLAPIHVTREFPAVRAARQLGTTRWAPPPPDVSWRTIVMIVVLGDVGFVIMLVSLFGVS